MNHDDVAVIAEEAARGVVSGLRVGTGLDVHQLAPDCPLVLAGVTVPSAVGLVGHSDADIVAHTVTDALLGAAGMKDIGTYFPSEDEQWRGADSMQLLAKVVEMIVADGCRVINVDAVVALQAPKLSPYKDEMCANLAKVIGIDASRVTVRATTTDHLGFVGRGEGAVTTATALLLR